MEKKLWLIVFWREVLVNMRMCMREQYRFINFEIFALIAMGVEAAYPVFSQFWLIFLPRYIQIETVQQNRNLIYCPFSRMNDCTLHII